MAVRGHHQPVVERAETAELFRQLGRTGRRRAPRPKLEVVALGERRQVHLHAVPQGVLERAHDVGAGPAQRLGKRLGVIVGGARPGSGATRLGQHDPGAVGQDLGGHGQLVEHERRGGFEPVGREAVGDPAQQVRDPLVADRGRRIARPRTHRFVEDQLARGPDLGDVDRAGRQLRGRHEPADRLDLIAPELQAHRSALLGREHIEHPAAHGELSPVLHHVDPHVAEVDEPFREPIGSGLGPAFDPDRLGGARRRRDPLQDGEHRRDHDEGSLGSAQQADRGRPPRRDLGCRGDQLVGQRLPRRQQHRTARQECRHVGDQRLGLMRPRRDGEDRRLERRRQPGQYEGVARLGLHFDRTGARRQEPLERLRSDQRLYVVRERHPGTPLPFGQHRKPPSRTTGASEGSLTGRTAQIACRVFRGEARRSWGSVVTSRSRLRTDIHRVNSIAETGLEM